MPSFSTKTKMKAVFTSVLTVLVLVFSLSPYSLSAHAEEEVKHTSGLCHNMGWGMTSGSPWGNTFSVYNAPDAPNRSFTLQEIVGSSVGFISYSGEGEGSFILADRVGLTPEWVKTDKSKLEQPHDTFTCITGGVGAAAGNTILGVTNTISSIAQSIVVSAMNASIICQADGDTNCIDLIRIIGGDGASDKGIIGTLTDGVYFPLLSLGVLLAVFSSFISAISKKSIREFLVNISWILISVLIGSFVYMYPALVTKAPATVSTTLGACVTSAFNGENCLTGESTKPAVDVSLGESTSKNICYSNSPNASFIEQMRMTVESSACHTWKAFILNNVAMAQYGVSFDALDTVDTSNQLNADLVAKGIDPQDYCINLASTQSVNSMLGGKLILNNESNKVCNLLAYQMYLTSNAVSGNDVISDNPDQDPRWYKLIDAVASNDNMWSTWAPSFTGGFNKVSYSIVGAIATLAGSFILVVSSLYALVYYLSSIILIIFAPLFTLMAVHPKGRGMFIGWVESITGNILKYFSSSVFLVVTVSIYSAILSTITSYITTILFVIIMSMALFMYRSELIRMMGSVSMGGTKMGNRVGDWINQKAGNVTNRGKNIAAGAVGGAIGSGLSGGSILSGARDSVHREFSRGSNGILANAVRQADRQNASANIQANQLRAERINETNQAVNEYNQAQNRLDEINSDMATNEMNQTILAEDLEEEKVNLLRAENTESVRGAELEEMNSQSEVARNADRKALEAMQLASQKKLADLQRTPKPRNRKKAGEHDAKIKAAQREVERNNAFVAMKELEMQVNDLRSQANVARETGNVDEAMRLTEEAHVLDLQRGKMMDESKISLPQITSLNEQFRKNSQTMREISGVSDYNEHTHEQLKVAHRIAQTDVQEISERIERKKDTLNLLSEQHSQKVDERHLAQEAVVETSRKAQDARELQEAFEQNVPERTGPQVSGTNRALNRAKKAVDEKQQEIRERKSLKDAKDIFSGLNTPEQVKPAPDADMGISDYLNFEPVPERKSILNPQGSQAPPAQPVTQDLPVVTPDSPTVNLPVMPPVTPPQKPTSGDSE